MLFRENDLAEVKQIVAPHALIRKKGRNSDIWISE